jgi:hypothetical protein
LGALLVAGLMLSACGTVSSVSALRTWVDKSDFRSSMSTLSGDVRSSASALRNASMTASDLHTVCGVLLLDTEEANASLPTPDTQATNLLSSAYTNLGAGANECYDAASPTQRARALLSLTKGYAELSEAKVRIDVASASV